MLTLPTLPPSLPIPHSLSECASFQHTIQPYLPSLYDLPSALVTRMHSASDLKSLYLATNPLISALALALALMPVFLVVSEVNRNWSQVDRVWSVLPTLFIAHFSLWAHLHRLPSQRVDHALAVASVWSLRLTYNYWRKGGYQRGSEDYRWLIIREKIGGVAFFLLNVVFTSSLQVVRALLSRGVLFGTLCY